MSPSAPPTGPTEALVLLRAFPGRSGFRVVGASDHAVRALTGALAVAGWSSESEPQVALATAEELATAGAVPASAVALAVREATAPSQRGWPVFDRRLQDDGWVGCLATEAWTIYVRETHAAELGPVLSFSATDQERFPDAVHTASRAALVEEILHWRTAALERWATRAQEEPGRTNKDLEHEIGHLRSLLEATQATLSWRVTAPLRRLQAARLKAMRS